MFSGLKGNILPITLGEQLSTIPVNYNKIKETVPRFLFAIFSEMGSC